MRTVLYPPGKVGSRSPARAPALNSAWSAVLGRTKTVLYKQSRFSNSRHTLTILKRLSESTVAISGGCGDIGQATARRLIQEGAHVVLLDRAPIEALSPDLLNDKNSAY